MEAFACRVDDVVLALDAEDALDVHGAVLDLEIVAGREQRPVAEALEHGPVVEVDVVHEPGTHRGDHAACPIRPAADMPCSTCSTSTRWPAGQNAKPERASSSSVPETKRA